MIGSQLIVLGLTLLLNDLSTTFKIEEESDLENLFGKTNGTNECSSSFFTLYFYFMGSTQLILLKRK